MRIEPQQIFWWSVTYVLVSVNNSAKVTGFGFGRVLAAFVLKDTCSTGAAKQLVPEDRSSVS